MVEEPNRAPTLEATTHAQGRSARALASFVTSSGFGLGLSLLGFWAAPRIVSALGAERYGLSRALIDLFGYLALIELGLAGASRPVIAREIVNADPSRKTIAFAIVGAAYVRSTTRKFFAALILTAAAPFLVRVGHIGRNEIIFGGCLLTLTTLATPLAAVQALLGAEQRDYLSNLAAGVQNLVVTISAVLFARWRWGVQGQAAAVLAGTCVLTVWLVWVARASISIALRTRPMPDDRAHFLLKSLNIPTFLRSVVGRVALLSDRIIVAMLLGGNAVTGFQSTLRLSESVFPHLLGIGNAAWPAMADIYARGDDDLFRKRLLEVTTTVCGAAILFLAPVLVVNEAFVNRWMGHDLFAGWTLTLIACSNVMLLALVNYWDWCFGSTSKIASIVPLTVASGVVNVMVSVLATIWLGPVGPALGTLVAIGCVVVPWEAHLLAQQFGVPRRRLAFAVVRPIAFGMVYIFAIRAAAKGFLNESWPRIAVIAAVTALGWGVIAWWAVFDPVARDTWRLRAIGLVARLRRR